MVKVSSGLGKLCLALFMMIFILPSLMAGAMSHTHFSQPVLDPVPVVAMADCHVVTAAVVDCCAAGMTEAKGGCAVACLSMGSGCMTASALPVAALTLPTPNLLSMGHPTAEALFASVSGRPDTPPPKA